MTAKVSSHSKTPRKKAATKPPEATAPPEAKAPLEADALPASAFSPPEVEFAARTPASLPERPRPSKRRAIFIDVENESRGARLEEVLAALEIDHTSAATDLVASGNWRVISHEAARLLAKNGALLVHSAPAVGVRDWSDLRIAVAAGAWLASARPGDRLDIVSADRAFDAVGDVAATLGIEFHRHGQRAHARAEPAGRLARAEAGTRPATPRRRRGGRGRAAAAAPLAAIKAPPPAEAASAPTEPTAAPVAAPQDEVLSVVRALLEASPRGVMLDAVANRLKAQGFERPPNSPRLVTRLRSMKDLKVSPGGLVTLAAAAEARR